MVKIELPKSGRSSIRVRTPLEIFAEPVDQARSQQAKERIQKQREEKRKVVLAALKKATKGKKSKANKLSKPKKSVPKARKPAKKPIKKAAPKAAPKRAPAAAKSAAPSPATVPDSTLKRSRSFSGNNNNNDTLPAKRSRSFTKNNSDAAPSQTPPAPRTRVLHAGPNAGMRQTGMKWQYLEKAPADWRDYTEDASAVVEQHYHEWQNNSEIDVRAVKSGDWHYQVDFATNKQTNVDHHAHTQRQIRRVIISK